MRLTPDPSRDLRRREREDARTLRQWWRDLWHSLRALRDSLLQRLRAILRPGERLRDPLTLAFTDALATAFRAFGATMARVATAAQVWALAYGAAHALTLARTLPALAHGVRPGFLADGSAIAEVGLRYGGEAVAALRQVVLLPTLTATRLARAVQPLYHRALLTARNELYRAYRTAVLAVARQGWWWQASLGPRCCPACVAKHGSYHGPDEGMHSHAGCRCVPVWAEPRQTGAAWLDEQDEATRRALLGPGKARLLDVGVITVDALAVPTRSARWGNGMRVATLAELTGGSDDGE